MSGLPSPAAQAQGSSTLKAKREVCGPEAVFAGFDLPSTRRHSLLYARASSRHPPSRSIHTCDSAVAA